MIVVSNLNFSPSVYHRNKLSITQPAMSYTDGNVVEWQQRLRIRLCEMMGYGDEERVPLAPRTLWKKEHPLGTIEKVVFTSEPYADVMAYVCLGHDIGIGFGSENHLLDCSQWMFFLP